MRTFVKVGMAYCASCDTHVDVIENVTSFPGVYFWPNHKMVLNNNLRGTEFEQTATCFGSLCRVVNYTAVQATL